jgi:subtilisin
VGGAVLDNQGMGLMSDVICGIDFVDSKSPARGGPMAVANMSLGGYGTDDGNCGNTNADAEHQAICRAVADGSPSWSPPGNNGGDVSRFIPAAYDEVITASALGDSDGQPCGAGAQTKYGPTATFPGGRTTRPRPRT